ncbi:uncharacterized protein LOC118438897 [Folsomia candida]|uniref:uncharacterized protein LOC118438897 n=1 Tax=Folsomia candida TaxID=158441 RepID=UPI001604CA46|nr:uncharacterized protein LOC118438897 [Folsomia candida]
MDSPPTTINLALGNPLILTAILKQNSAPLRNCRLVSHFWNDIVLSLQNTRFALKLRRNGDENVDHDPVPFFDTCFTFDPRLAKRVNAATCCTDALHSLAAIYSFAAKLLHLSEKFSDRIEVLYPLRQLFGFNLSHLEKLVSEFERIQDQMYVGNSCESEFSEAPEANFIHGIGN